MDVPRIADDGRLSGQVVHVEKLGGDTNVLVDSPAGRITVRLFGQYEIAPDQGVSLTWDDADGFSFSADGQRIAA